MASPIPGLQKQIDRPPAVIPRQMFIAEMASANSVMVAGSRVEVFTTDESPSSVAVSDRVRMLFVPETQQCFVIEKIA